ncbi:MAG: pseudouridine-5'-phosphate glycosidase [Phototrophicaceae bacterium]
MLLTFSDEVRQALRNGNPIVALESTVITHGLPYPTNRDTALAMEKAVRDAGAVPATIAVLSGQIMVGLSTDQIEYLAKAQDVRKCSRRDFPIALGLGEDAATTVAGTMIVAHMAGIRVFATGGIGGVHRGHPFDVSADLLELGRTPVTVVCSGAKSILDLPLTLEVLETQGVPILGYQTDTLPMFYSRSSGLPIDARVENPEQIAQIMRAAQALNAQHGILVTVPVPATDELDSAIAEQAIEQATREADEQGIHGKQLTPFVLGRIVELTNGQSMTANQALLSNNAKIAAQIAASI